MNLAAQRTTYHIFLPVGCTLSPSTPHVVALSTQEDTNMALLVKQVWIEVHVAFHESVIARLSQQQGHDSGWGTANIHICTTSTPPGTLHLTSTLLTLQSYTHTDKAFYKYSTVL